MIDNFYLKDYLTFEQIQMEFDKGLIVFTGASGAGKSILMKALLATLGKEDATASLSEICFENFALDIEQYDIKKGDDVVIKQIKKDKVRFFINNQNSSKKYINELTNKIIRHLHHKDNSDFDSNTLLSYLDNISIKDDKNYKDILQTYKNDFSKLTAMQKELNRLINDEKDLEQLKEFTKFEINQIEQLDPKVDEYEQLNTIKKQLSKKDKIEDAISSAKEIFAIAPNVSSALNTLDVDSSFFDDCINEVNNIFESSQDFLDNLEGVDIEATLDRIEELSKLQKRFGTIQEALNYKEQKKQELESYENISFEKAILEKNIKKLSLSLEELAKQITTFRKSALDTAHKKINYYLKFLYLCNAKLRLHNI
jgi:DNA repair protein RecN (Recombination protein N)